MAVKVYRPEYPGLYYFDTFTFTTLGASGRIGPDSSKTYANAPWRDGDFSIGEGQQRWTAPANGTYQIMAAGAYGAQPGRVVTGQVKLSAGQVVSLLVGQMPTPLIAIETDNVTVGGGGGTFVVSNGTPLMVASGGDGSGGSSRAGDFLPSGDGNGQSGAGYFTNGTQPSDPFFQFLTPAAYVNGGFGNHYNYGTMAVPEEGGFGGGQCPLGLVTLIVTIDGDGSTVYVTTNVPHGYPYNYVVMITGTSLFDGMWGIVVTGPDSFAFVSDIVGSETSGFVSGTAVGISGGGGYTGSPGDGTSGATCYADPNVVDFTDLGATSNSAGYVTVTLIDPVPLTQTWTWDETFQSSASNGPFRTLQWSSELNTFLSMSGSSTDGITWAGSPYISPSIQTLMFVAYSPTLQLYVGILRKPNLSTQFLANSVDGITWNPLFDISSAQTSTSSIIWSVELSRFVVVELLKIWYSDNGINWNLAYSGGSLVGFAYAPSINTFVVTKFRSPLYSTDGISWAESFDDTYSDGSWKGVAWSPILNLFVTVSTRLSGSHLVYSSDGQTWEDANVAFNVSSDTRWSVVTWSDFGIFSVLGPDGYSAYSSDGINWTALRVSVQSPDSIAYSPTLKFFVCVAGNSFFISIDGIYWIPKNIFGINAGAWSPELGLFVTYNGFTSNDGITWTPPPETTSFIQITWISLLGLFIGVDLVRYHYYYSYDGNTWIQSSYSGLISRIAWSPEKCIIVGGAAYSRDGITWVDSVNRVMNMNFSPGWSKELGLFTGVDTSYSYYSYDGINWAQGNFDTPFVPTGTVAWSPKVKMFICTGVIGGQSCYIYSVDGLNWPIINFVINSVIWINELSLFVAGRISNGTYTSADGLNWVKLSTQLVCSNMWSPELGRLTAAGGYSDATKTF